MSRWEVALIEKTGKTKKTCQTSGFIKGVQNIWILHAILRKEIYFWNYLRWKTWWENTEASFKSYQKNHWIPFGIYIWILLISNQNCCSLYLRDEMCVASGRYFLEWASSRLFVEAAFSEVSRSDINDLVLNLRSSMKDLIDQSSWLEETVSKITWH